MNKTLLYGGAAVAVVAGVGVVWYFSRRAGVNPGNSSGAVNAANKAPVGQPGKNTTGTNAYDFGVALVTAGAGAFSSYERSKTSATQV